MRRKLPVGIQDFDKIRNENYIYVDKTDMIWTLANGVQNNFISRPRRFGKSLLTSTLQCYFEGRKELFEGLKIMELEKNWKKCKVLHFDFSGKESAKSLEDYLNGQLEEYERLYGGGPYNNLNDRFRKVIENAAKQSEDRTVVLVDEYDAPLQKTLFDKEEHDKVRDIYRNFFPALKFELKMDNNGGIEAAKKQLYDRNYLSAFSSEARPVYAIAVSFSSEEGKRGMTAWELLKK